MVTGMSPGQIAFAIWGAMVASLGLVMALLKTNPDEITSNVSKWAAWAGVRNISGWLRARRADHATFRFLRLSLIITLILGGGVIAVRFSNSDEQASISTRIKTADTRPRPSDLLMNIDFPDKSRLGMSEDVRLNITFQNKTDDEISVRRIFLIQAIRHDPAYNGDSTHFENDCFDPVYEPPDESPQLLRDKPLFHSDRGYISITTLPKSIDVSGEKRMNSSLSISSKKNITVEATFTAQKIDLQNNLTVFCPVTQIYDGEGKPKTIRCKGSSAGYTLLPDGRYDGMIFGGYFRTVAVTPNPDLHKQCVIFDR